VIPVQRARAAISKPIAFALSLARRRFDPSREAALRIDIKDRDRCAAARPGNGELSGEVVFPAPPLRCSIVMTSPTMRTGFETSVPGERG